MATSAMDQAFKTIQKLADDFTAGTDHFFSKEYQEAEARKDFIDKFFIALGWDVNHDTQINPYEQEVKVERHVSERFGAALRRVDYAFFVNPNYRDPRMIVEAKKPTRDIATADNCFQTVRYGWIKQIPVAALTDFAELHILDCRYKPDINTAIHCGVRKYTIQDYIDKEKFAEIYWLLSHEAVAAGSLEKFAKTLEQRRPGGRQQRLLGGFQNFDESFLEDLVNYRTALATAFKSKNPDLDSATLTEITQRTLDRLVFMRFLEDKLIEPTHFVRQFGKRGTAWQDFVGNSRRLDGIYNGIVFKKHAILDAPDLPIDDSSFARIAEELSHQNSPYDFNAIPIHILGSIYERFLGNVIVATAKRVRVEPKPEVRRAGGVYYTPDHVVRKIVDRSVGRMIAGKTPDQIASMRFADIACGSGSFLLGVYDQLLHYHAKYYADNPKKRRKFDVTLKDGILHLSLEKKREILLNNIFGVDIDSQAVEVTQLSLYLKLLEEETIASAQGYQLRIHAAILPSLNKNVVCGNSLVGRDVSLTDLFMEEEDERKLSPMDFEDAFPQIMSQGGFDAIVGNPPYDVLEKDRGASSWPHEILAVYGKWKRGYEPALGRKLNLFRFFIVRCLALLKAQGRLGLIVPLALLADISCARTRKHLMASAVDVEGDCFPQKDNRNRRIFRDAKLSTVVLGGVKRGESDSMEAVIRVRVYPWNSFDDEFRESFVQFKDTALIDPENMPIPLVDGSAWQLCLRLHSLPKIKRLGEITDFRVTRGEINQTIYREYINDDPKLSRLLKGGEVGQYEQRTKLKQGIKEWFDERKFLKANTPRPVVDKRRIATQRITGMDERLRIVATIVDPPAYFADSTNSIALTANASYRLEYLLALLNSQLFQWRFKLTSTNNNVGTNELDAMPIRTIDFNDVTESGFHDEIVTLVEKLLAWRPKINTAKSDGDIRFYTGKYDAAEKRIATIINQLYGLTDADLHVIEGTAGCYWRVL